MLCFWNQKLAQTDERLKSEFNDSFSYNSSFDTHIITNYHDKYNYIIIIIINYRGATHSHTYQLISAK